jgi:hypothetical protein
MPALVSAGRWWERAAGYEIYVPSFADGNGDGLGDLTGICERLDYLAWLGIDLIWLTPFYLSPLADHGYDVAGHCHVDPRFGDAAAFGAVIAEAHRLGLQVLIDLVANHTSAGHPWFRASRSSRSSAQRDWYIWRDPAPGGGPPNNWASAFGGPAWAFDPATAQWYLHLHLPEQPDLNWSNSSPPSRPPLKSSAWRCGTWRSSAARTQRSAARGGNRRCRRSRSTSTAGSRPHETRHVHLHRRSDAPFLAWRLCQGPMRRPVQGLGGWVDRAEFADRRSRLGAYVGLAHTGLGGWVGCCLAGTGLAASAESRQES